MSPAAHALAEEQGLSLVCVSPRANPPVYRIMNYSRFKYENAKRNKARTAPRHHQGSAPPR